MRNSYQDPRPQTPNFKLLLLEIGTEEIPSRFIPQALEKMAEIIKGLLRENRIDFGKVWTAGTPRRLVLTIEDLAEYQKDIKREVIGPSKGLAYDESGQPTKAAYGFANGQGVSVKDLKIKATEKGEYLCAVFEEKGLESEAILPEILTKFIASIPFPKYMRWMNKNLRFARPIHWILAIYNNKIIPFEIEGIRSGNMTRGHRFMSPGVFLVKEIKAFPHLLETNFVILDQEKRKAMIEKELKRLSESIGGGILPDDELLREVTYLVEYPVAYLGSFDKGYLTLPKEVLINAMREHQRYFSIVDASQELLPYFVAISNTKAEDMDVVRLGNERVLRARLEDARFYFEEDLKKRLEHRVDELKGVTYHERLGTMYQKVERVIALSSHLARKIEPGLEGIVRRAAYLCKADLVTGIVKEFPKLQGVMGRRYALLSGEEPQVAEAIYEHYLPTFSGDEMPRSKAGAILSIGDKMDTIAGFFAIGLLPTGSEDPYALRRQAQGIINILISSIINPHSLPSLNELIDKAIEPFRTLLPERKINPRIKEDILGFFRQRIAYILTLEGHSEEVVEAILSTGFDHPWDVKKRVSIITDFCDRGEFGPLLTAVKRVINILPKGLKGTLKGELLGEGAERDLYNIYMNCKGRFEATLRERDYSGALEALIPLREAIDNFFDRVLVMDKREDVRINRLSLLRAIHDLFYRIADFSKIVSG